MINNQSMLDATKLITGKDGQLFVTLNDSSYLFLAKVDTFQVHLSINNTEYQ